jgi:hypothetical protein
LLTHRFRNPVTKEIKLPSIQLTSYSVRITDANLKHSFPFDNYSGGADLFLIMDQTFTTLKQSRSTDMQEQTSFGIRQYSVNTTERQISGILTSGDFGYEAELIDIDSNQIKYRRKPKETEPRPFYFLVYLPKGSDRGILLLERIGMYGVKTVFSKYFESLFVNTYIDRRFFLSLLTPDYLIESVLKNGRFTEIRFIQTGIPNNFEDVIENSYGNLLVKGKFEQVIKAPPAGYLVVADKIRSFWKDQRNVRNMFEIPDVEEIKAKVDINGHYRTMDIGNLDRFRPNFDITDKVRRGPDGHPTYESLNEAALELLNDFMRD